MKSRYVSRPSPVSNMYDFPGVLRARWRTATNPASPPSPRVRDKINESLTHRSHAGIGGEARFGRTIWEASSFRVLTLGAQSKPASKPTMPPWRGYGPTVSALLVPIVTPHTSLRSKTAISSRCGLGKDKFITRDCCATRWTSVRSSNARYSGRLDLGRRRRCPERAQALRGLLWKWPLKFQHLLIKGDKSDRREPPPAHLSSPAGAGIVFLRGRAEAAGGARSERAPRRRRRVT
jgi:hypothetical protein